jgi:hypothetical protein
MTDRELFSTMKRRIELFASRRLPLHQLVNDLKSLESGLISVSQSWHSKFQKEWIALEEVNAIRLDEEYSGSDDFEVFLNETCGRLLQLIATSDSPPSSSRE